MRNGLEFFKNVCLEKATSWAHLPRYSWNCFLASLPEVRFGRFSLDLRLVDFFQFTSWLYVNWIWLKSTRVYADPLVGKTLRFYTSWPRRLFFFWIAVRSSSHPPASLILYVKFYVIFYVKFYVLFLRELLRSFSTWIIAYVFSMWIPAVGNN